MDRTLRLLSVGAHPADCFDHCGGTLARHAAREDYVACVVLTHGARVHDKVISDSMFHRREIPDGDELVPMIEQRSDSKMEETRRACGLLGVEDVTFIGADDAILMVTRELVRRVAGLIRLKKPDLVLTHFPRENDCSTGAHSVTGQITLRAVRYAASVDPGDRNPPHRTAQVFFFGSSAARVRGDVWESEGGFSNDVFVDTTDVIDKKLAALDCLVSQGYSGRYARKRIEGIDGACGIRACCAYAEGFISMNAQLTRYLPVTEEMLELASESDHETIARYSYRATAEELGAKGS